MILYWKYLEKKLGNSFSSLNKTSNIIFPIKLCDKVISYYSFEGDLVFDPFAGSGSVGLSAIKNNRHFFLTEINKEYFKILKDKFNSNLFDNINLRNDILEKAKSKGKIIHTRSALLQGLFFKDKDDLNINVQNLKKQLTLLSSISKRDSASISELALSYCFKQKLIET